MHRASLLVLMMIGCSGAPAPGPGPASTTAAADAATAANADADTDADTRGYECRPFNTPPPINEHCTAWAPPAAAPDDPKNRAGAKAQFQLGNTRFQNGDYVGAVEAFERAYELAQLPEIIFNIGVAHERARDLDCAIDAFNWFVDQKGAVKIPEGLTERVERLEREREAWLARVKEAEGC